MGSPQESAFPSMPPSDDTSIGAAASQQEPPPLPLLHLTPQWLASLQALYAGGAATATVVAVPPAFCSPPAFWGPQEPYGDAIPFTALCLPMTMPYPAAGIEGRPLLAEEEKNERPATEAEGSPVESAGGGKVSSSSEENASRSGDSVKEGSSDIQDADSEQKDLSSLRKRRHGGIIAEGEVSHPVTAGKYNDINAESSYVGGEKSAKTLSVPSPGRALSPSPKIDLNIGMDLWCASHSRPMTEVNFGPLMVGNDPVVHQQQQLLDERESRIERLRRINRESARRSRLRKKQESEDTERRMAAVENEKCILEKRVEELEAVVRTMMEGLIKHLGPARVVDIVGTRPMEVLFRS